MSKCQLPDVELPRMPISVLENTLRILKRIQNGSFSGHSFTCIWVKVYGGIYSRWQWEKFLERLGVSLKGYGLLKDNRPSFFPPNLTELEARIWLIQQVLYENEAMAK